ncbi:MalY/PatB family protein [Pelagovum sp. HNIBRBA483]|uniref:MalY/PatB family protein n=1 Tax=Pelagovum sp. HNIBRBA483 TaxID=3233341 RepID=UPI0034A23783
MNFDELIDRRGKSVTKWDSIDLLYDMPTEDALAMWIADMDFRPAACVQQAAEELLRRNDYGYFTHFDRYYDAVGWWAENRHGWKIEPDWISVTGGLGNGIAIAIQTYTNPGDEIVIFTPVYQEFAVKTRNAGRAVRELPLAIGADGKFRMDFEHYQELLSGRERLVLLSSPHNPAGRVWSADELRDLVAFCRKNNLLLISDEVHQDIVFPGFEHQTILKVLPDAVDMTIVTSSASKTFNIAGLRTGNVIIPDPKLRKKYKNFCRSLDMSPNLFGMRMTEAVYSPAGAEWVDALCSYLAENARLFNDGTNRIAGVTAMEMEATYLAWLDFGGTGLSTDEIVRRVVDGARIAPTPGVPLGTGGETGLRFNLAMPRVRIEEAVSRLQSTFAVNW